MENNPTDNINNNNYDSQVIDQNQSETQIPEKKLPFSMPQAKRLKTDTIKKFLPIGITTIVLLFVTSFAVSGLIRVKSVPEGNNPIIPTPTEEPIIPGSRDLYPVATSAAFLKLEEQMSSISAELIPFEPEDQSILPPDIELPLGFQKD